MMERRLLYRLAGWSAYLSGIAAILTLLTVPIFMVFGLPYNLVSNISELVWFILIIPVAIALYQQLHSSAWFFGLVALVIGIVGLLYSTVMTLLINFGPPDFGDNGTFQTATIGFWFLATSFLLLSNNLQPDGLSWLGILIGISYVVGLVGLFLKDSLLFIFGFHLLVLTLLYPIWAFWTGHVLLRKM